jgi:hypothetical protein
LVPPHPDGDEVAHEFEQQLRLWHQLVIAHRSRLDASEEVVDADVECARDLVKLTGGDPVDALIRSCVLAGT